MKVVAAVLTYKTEEFGRVESLRETIASLQNQCDEVIVINNDGVRRDLPVRQYVNTSDNQTSGHGTNLQARVAIGAGADLVVLSDDDMVWRVGWGNAFDVWWMDAPEDIWLTGCHLEPLYGWNALSPECIEWELGRALIRNSAGAASWSFRAKDWSKIGPVPQKRQGWGDVPTCQRVRANGGRIAQLDLAEHRGLVSTWGNESSSFTQEQVAPVRAKLEGSHGHMPAVRR